MVSSKTDVSLYIKDLESEETYITFQNPSRVNQIKKKTKIQQSADSTKKYISYCQIQIWFYLKFKTFQREKPIQLKISSNKMPTTTIHAHLMDLLLDLQDLYTMPSQKPPNFTKKQCQESEN